MTWFFVVILLSHVEIHHFDHRHECEQVRKQWEQQVARTNVIHIGSHCSPMLVDIGVQA